MQPGIFGQVMGSRNAHTLRARCLRSSAQVTDSQLNSTAEKAIREYQARPWTNDPSGTYQMRNLLGSITFAIALPCWSLTDRTETGCLPFRASAYDKPPLARTVEEASFKIPPGQPLECDHRGFSVLGLSLLHMFSCMLTRLVVNLLLPEECISRPSHSKALLFSYAASCLGLYLAPRSRQIPVSCGIKQVFSYIRLHSSQ